MARCGALEFPRVFIPPHVRNLFSLFPLRRSGGRHILGALNLVIVVTRVLVLSQTPFKVSESRKDTGSCQDEVCSGVWR